MQHGLPWSQRSDWTIAATAFRSLLVAFDPIFAHATKVVPWTRNHKVSRYGAPAGALPIVQYRPSGAGRGGFATRPCDNFGSGSVAMIRPTPRAGRTRLDDRIDEHDALTQRS